ncbi:MAG: hypothetical protein NVS9B6_09730 [Candidatus Limnocylindrales bacterium]
MGKLVGSRLGRSIVTFSVAFAVAIPVAQAAGSSVVPSGPVPRTIRADVAAQPVVGPETPTVPVPHVFSDPVAKVSFDPPAGWLRGPDAALNPVSDPAEPVFELVRYQIRIGDPTLYAQPIPVTSGLIADAGAIISIGLAREGTEVAGLEVDPRTERDAVRSAGGFLVVNEERIYEGLHVYTRFLLARATDRRIVLRAVAPADDWSAVGPLVIAALDSVHAADDVANAPAAPPPAPVVIAAVAPAAATPILDASLAQRDDIIARAAAMLGTPYVWGGDRPYVGLDCGAYVSAALGMPWHTTDALWQITVVVGKEDLRAGDVMNLTTGRDPEGFGHVRMFDAWANAAHTLVWVYEETPPRAVHRVIAYDGRYQPLRLIGLSGAGEARLIPAPAADPEPGFAPSSRRAARPEVPAQTERPVRTPRPIATPRPFATPRPIVTRRPPLTSRPTLRVAPLLRPAPTARR